MLSKDCCIKKNNFLVMLVSHNLSCILYDIYNLQRCGKPDIQGYRQRMRLQRRMNVISLNPFLTFMVPCRQKLDSLYSKSFKY